MSLVCGDPVQRYLSWQKTGNNQVPVNKGLGKEGMVLPYRARDVTVRQKEAAFRVLMYSALREDLPDRLFDEKARY